MIINIFNLILNIPCGDKSIFFMFFLCLYAIFYNA